MTNNEIPTGQWISTQDAMPDVKTRVVFLTPKDTCYGWFDGSYWQDFLQMDFEGEPEWYPIRQVSHWLRLPPRPEE